MFDHDLRLWGRPGRGTWEYPLNCVDIKEARLKGINRTNAQALFSEEVPMMDHQPLLQTTMQSETISHYKAACWLKGPSCKGSSQQTLFHKMLMNQIKNQILLPPSVAKDHLSSSDVAVVIRCGFKHVPGPGVGPTVGGASGSSSSSSVAIAPPESELSSSPFVKVFFLTKVCFKPSSAVFAQMVLKSTADHPSLPATCSADLRLDSQGRFVFQSSWDLCRELLELQKQFTSVVYLNVLKHKPL